MSEREVHVSGTLTFPGLLAIAFIVLKLTHVIAWSWLWVLVPLWAPVVLWLTFLTGILVWSEWGRQR